MPTNPTRNTLHEYARLGAMRRLEEIRQEEARIRAAFPELFRGRPGRPAATGGGQSAGAVEARQRRRGSRMSAAQRRAVSERMKKYWAARRKAKNG